jgi:hypothetical protein
MGSVIDPMAVVDHHLRVHGVDRLRVVDSSVIPKVVAGTEERFFYFFIQVAKKKRDPFASNFISSLQQSHVTLAPLWS